MTRRRNVAAGRRRCRAPTRRQVGRIAFRSSAATACSAASASRTSSASTRSANPRCACSRTVAVEHGRGARERAPVRRDAAAAEGDRAARRRAGGDQQHAAGRRRRARLPGDRTTSVGDKIREMLENADDARHPLVRPPRPVWSTTPTTFEHGVRSHRFRPRRHDRLSRRTIIVERASRSSSEPTATPRSRSKDGDPLGHRYADKSRLQRPDRRAATTRHRRSSSSRMTARARVLRIRRAPAVRRSPTA